MSCTLCGEPGVKLGMICQYCGYTPVEYLTEAGEKKGRELMDERRKERLSCIDEIGFTAVEMEFGGAYFKKGNMTKREIALIYKPDSTSNEIHGYNVHVAADQSICLYKKAAGKVTPFNANIAVLPSVKQFLLGAQVNERLKLNLYCRADASLEWGQPVAEDIKLGNSLVET